MVVLLTIYLAVGVTLGGYAAYRILTDDPPGLEWHHRAFVVCAALFLWPLGVGILAMEAVEWWVRRRRGG